MEYILQSVFIFSICFAILRLLVSLYNFFSNPVLEKYSDTSFHSPSKVLLSILVPARNEEANLPILINSLLKQDFKEYELIVLDDSSTDSTYSILQEYALAHTHIKVLEGEELPVGWLGKNWACHQLAKHASGKYMLFLDADVQVGGPAINKAIKVAEKEELTLLSIFPEQKIFSEGERRTVPLMHYLLLSLLPLDFIYFFRQPSLSAANGQFMLFNAEDYRSYSLHKACKAEIVEDIRIMQTIKAHGLKGRTLLGNNLIFCRMYQSYKEGISGFSKNILAGFGNSKMALVIYLFIIILVPVLMGVFRPYLAFLYFLIVVIMRFVISRTANQFLPNFIYYHFFQMVSLLLISFNSIQNSYTKELEWKGRKI